jgi:hypothetical protein
MPLVVYSNFKLRSFGSRAHDLSIELNSPVLEKDLGKCVGRKCACPSCCTMGCSYQISLVTDWEMRWRLRRHSSMSSCGLKPVGFKNIRSTAYFEGINNLGITQGTCNSQFLWDLGWITLVISTDTLDFGVQYRSWNPA